MDWSTIAICLVAAYAVFLVGCVITMGLSGIEIGLLVLLTVSMAIAFGLYSSMTSAPPVNSSVEEAHNHVKQVQFLRQVGDIHFTAAMVFGALFLISATIHTWQARAKVFPFLFSENKPVTTSDTEPE